MTTETTVTPKTRATKQTRVTRRPLFQRGPQTISGDLDKDFHYRFVNDTGARISQLQQAGYELVTDESLVVGDSRVSDPSQLGSAHRVISRDGTISYLMRQKKEYFEEDQQAKRDHVNELEKAMTSEASQGRYGKLKLDRD